MAVDVSTSVGALRVGLPRELFRQRTFGSAVFNMDPDGRRFLLMVNPQQSTPDERPRPLTVVVNWLSTFRK